MTVRLEELLAASTPGPWKALVEGGWVEGIEMGEDDFIQTDGGHYGPNAHNAALIALVPDAVRLLIDMGEILEEVRRTPGLDYGDCRAPTCEHPGCLKTRHLDALLARLERLGESRDAISDGLDRLGNKP